MRPSSAGLLIALGWLLMPSIHTVPAAAQAPTVVVGRPDPGRYHVEPHLASDPRTPERVALAAMSVAGTRGEDWKVVAFHSRDGGAHWHPSPLPRLEDEYCEGDPWLSWSASGPLYLTCLARDWRPDRSDFDFAVLLYRSEDGGATWLTPRKVPVDVPSTWDHPVVVALDEGDAMVAGTRSRAGASDGFSAATYRREADSFGTMIDYFTPEQTNDIMGSFTVGEEGRPMAAYFYMRSQPPRPFWVVRMDEDGAEARTLVSENILPWGFPMLLAGHEAGVVYALWIVESADGGLDPLLARSSNWGTSWSEPVTVVDDGSSPAFRSRVHLAITPEGAVLASWWDTRHGQNTLCGDTFVRKFDDRARALGEAIRVSEETACPTPEQEPVARRWRGGGDYGAVAVAGADSAYVAWASGGSDGHRIRVRKVGLSPRGTGGH